MVDDGLHRIFVNTVVDDGTDLANLMSCFTKKMVNNPKFPIFTKRMRELKEEEGGVTAVCEVMKKYEQIAAEKARAEGHAQGHEQGRTEERKATMRKMLKRGDTPEEIADFYDIDIAEVEMVEKEMCTLA